MIQRVDSLVTAIREAARREPTHPKDLLHPEILVGTALRIAGAVAIALFLWWMLRIIIRRIETSLGTPQPGQLTVSEQRTRTLVSLLRSVGRVIIVVTFLFMLMGAVGLDLRPLLAGAGVVGLAISFGAQSLVKDVISGLFILIENQFGVGDVVRIEGVSGAVERMTLRVVALRDVHGVVHIVPNGQITKVSNLTRTWARVVLDVSVAYREDTDHVIEVMRDVGHALWEDEDWKALLVDAPEVPGIESFDSGSVTIRMTAKTLPLKQWDVARELRRRLKRRFAEEEIEVPLGQTLLWERTEAPPQEFPAALAARARETASPVPPAAAHPHHSDAGLDDDPA